MANPVTWFEIVGKDATKLHSFYRDVFGWDLAPPVAEMGNYSTIDHHGEGIGGGIGEDPSGQARTTIYIEVDDPQAYLDKAGQAGAMTLMPVMHVMEGVDIAMYSDPEGNVIGLLKSNPM